jgi:hypothetical protein
MTICVPKLSEAVMRHDPASGAIVIMLRSLKMYGLAQAVTDLMEQGAPAFEAAVPILLQLLKAELAERTAKRNEQERQQRERGRGPRGWPGRGDQGKTLIEIERYLNDRSDSDTLAQEVADVENMMAQMREILSDALVDRWQQYKLLRPAPDW